MPTIPGRLTLPCLLAAFIAALTLQPATAQKEPLELSHIYGPDALDFSPDLPRIRWLPGGRDYLQAEDNGDDGVSWSFVDAATGDAEPFYDPEPLAAALQEQLRLDGEDAASRRGRGRCVCRRPPTGYCSNSHRTCSCGTSTPKR